MAIHCRGYRKLRENKVVLRLVMCAGEMWSSNLADLSSGLQQIKDHMHILKDVSLFDIYQNIC